MNNRHMPNWLTLVFGLFLLLIVSGCKKDSDEGGGGDPGEQPVSLEVAPYAYSMKVGTSQQYYAVGIFADGSKKDLSAEVKWSTSGSEASASDSGLVKSAAAGEVEVVVQLGEVQAQAPLTVHDKKTLSLQIEPPVIELGMGEKIEVRAAAFFEDGSQQSVVFDVSGQLSDGSEIIGIAGSSAVSGSAKSIPVEASENEDLFDQYAVIEGLEVGSDTLKINFDGASAEAPVAVTDAETLTRIVVEPAESETTVGGMISYQAQGIYGDDSVRDLTQSVDWSVSDEGIAAISNELQAKGRLTALSAGSTKVEASFQGVMGSTGLSVSEKSIESIEVLPPNAEILPLEFARFTAIAHFEDHTTLDITQEATWTSSEPEVAVIGNADQWVGAAIGLQEGQTEIAAQFKGVQSTVANLEVKRVKLESIQITPAQLATPAGTFTQLTATAFYDDASSADVTRDVSWKSSDPGTVAVATGTEAAGLTRALSVGKAEIVGSYLGKASLATVAVTPATVRSLIVTPASVSLADGQVTKLRAVAIYSDLSWVDVTPHAVWLSENEKVAAVSMKGETAGVVQAQSPGEAKITAAWEGQSAASTIQVTDAEFAFLQVEPVVAAFAKGTTLQFRATAYFTDSSSKDVTDVVTWESGNTDVLIVGNQKGGQGLAYGLLEGKAEVTAYLGVESRTVQAIVNPAELESLTLTPQLTTAPAGKTLKYRASGLFSDGSEQDLTYSASWESSNPEVALPSGVGAASGHVQAMSEGSAIIRARVDDVVGQAGLVVTAATIESIQVTPADLIEPAGTSGLMTAKATLSDGSTSDVTRRVSWVSSNEEVVSVTTGGDSAGLALLLTKGTAQVSAHLDGVSGVVDVQVTDAVLTAITVSPLMPTVPAGIAQDFSAFGVFSDGTTTPLDEDVSWQSSDLEVATMDVDGLASTWKAGEVTVTASLGEIFGTASLSVSAAEIASIQLSPPISEEPAGTSGRLVATATLTDLSTQVVTAEAVWSSTDTEIVVVGNGTFAGLAYLLSPGQVRVSASIGHVSGSLDIVVTDAVLEAILIEPVAPSIASGRGIDFDAIGVFSDASTTPIDSDVFWTSSDDSVATIDAEGQALGLKPGTTTITVNNGEGISTTTVLTVTDAVLESIDLNPQNASLPAGRSGVFEVTGIYSDSSTAPISTDLIWSTVDPKIASVDQGEVFAVKVGSTVLNVSHGASGLSDSAGIEVTAALLESLLVSVDDATLAKGTQGQAYVVGIYSDGQVQDLTLQATWTSVDPAVATMGNAQGEEGAIWAINVGETSIEARVDDLTDTYPIAVTEPVLAGLRVEPDAHVLALGLSEQYTAYGDYTDGSSQNLTNEVVWTSTDVDVAEVSSSGLAVSKSVGATNVTASLAGISQGALLTVDDTIPVLEVTPADPGIVLHSSIQFTASLLFGSEVDDITDSVVWSSSDEARVTIKTGGKDVGQATGESPGTATVTATYYHQPSDTTLTVTQAAAVLDLPEIPDSFEFQPAVPTMGKDSELQMAFYGVWNPGTPQEHKQDLTTSSESSWKSDDKGVVDVDNKNHKGRLKSKGKDGEAEITVEYRGEDFSVTATVTP